MKVRDDIKELYEEVVACRRYLHAHPEIGFDVANTEAFIIHKLEEYGVDIVAKDIAMHGVVGAIVIDDTVGIGFRSDMDALPMIEENEVSFKSCNGYAHNCGHDGHMAALLGLARYLSTHRSNLRKSVYFIFQPAEEGPGGAEVMISEGLFEKFRMEAIFGTHMMGEVAEGVIASKPGALMARNGEVRIKVMGKSTHGATPHLGRDAIVAGCALVSDLQSIVSRDVAPIEGAVVSIGSFHGGTAENIIAEEVDMLGTIRAFDDDVYDLIKQRITKICEGIEIMYQVKIELELLDFYYVVNNDEHLYDMLNKVCDGELLEVKPNMTAEDFSYYQRVVPGLFYYIGTKSEVFDQNLHNASYNFDEKVLLNVIETNVRLLEEMEAYHD